jgi:D-apiose dehydrogenase
MKTLRGILIGAGYFARFQAEAWRRIQNVEIVAVVDAQPEKAVAFANEFKIPKTYDSALAALKSERPDFVDIVTRPEWHLELSRLAAGHGAHVICQKPMAPTMSECISMCEACETSGVRLVIHENWRWQPWYRETQRLLRQGAIGKLFQISFFWRTGDGRGPAPYPAQPYFREMPRLLIYESLVHILDTYRYLGSEIDSVVCQTARINPAIAGEDHAIIQTRFASGVHGLIDGNRITGPNPAPVVMGTMLLEGAEGKIQISANGEIFLNDKKQPFHPPNIGYKGDSVFATQQHLVDSLRSGVASESDGREYLKTVALVEACYKSAAEFNVQRPCK